MADIAVPDTFRPPIEDVTDPDSVKALLLKDHAGNIDWVASAKARIINPRANIPGDSSFTHESSFTFGFDFYLPGPVEMFDAFFPHTAHTDLLSCQSCHPTIFPRRNTDIKMADVLQGKYCGECHGKVAFPPVTACERCHTGLQQAPNRAQPDFLGTLLLARAKNKQAPNEAVAENEASGDDAVLDSLREAVSGFSTNALPNATFPHWVHRIRFKCKACHPSVFIPENGANNITMLDINEGRFCGKCHNGTTAFSAGFGECESCHIPVVEVMDG